jgi:cytochrome c peroxidase
MRGKASFSQQEKKGYLLFQKHCANCHQEPLFTNYTFVNNGIGEDQHLHDLGRYRVTKDSNDLLKFKVPSLRNIEFTAPYMHDGRFASLKDVLRFYASPHPTQANTDNSVKHPFPLSANDQVDLLAFLLCLSDKHFIFNPQHAYPKSMLKN